MCTYNVCGNKHVARNIHVHVYTIQGLFGFCSRGGGGGGAMSSAKILGGGGHVYGRKPIF